MDRQRRMLNALTVFLLGVGVLVLFLGPCAGLYSIAVGFVGLIAFWVVAITLRVYHVSTPKDDDYWSYR
ncbi:MAG: hypothetical protein NTZ04_08445 [Chloroflexi bacterium]|nr:hypothetical protein [Chloroflexota bacterium]